MGLIAQIKNVFAPKDEEEFNLEVKNAIILPNEEADTEVEIIDNSQGGFGSMRHVVNFGQTSANVKNLVLSYRDMAVYPEIDSAIQEITNEAIVIETEAVVQLDIDVEDDVISEKIRDMIKDEFNGILKMMEFNHTGDEIFRQWYEDGRLYLHGLIDLKKPKLGIQDIKVLSPLNLRRLKEDNAYWYLYEDQKSNTALKIPSDHITFCPSGLISADKEVFLSYLHKSIKPFNQLKMLEDSAVIYRITRAPERRVFYVDVGQMNKSKAEAYMTNLMNKFRNRVTYDSSSGEVNQQKNTMTMTEDFWLPSSESGAGSRGTRIDTLPPGQNLGEMGDIEYFKKKLLRSLRVPYSRFDNEDPGSMGFGNMNGEMSRDEVRFTKFINKLRSKFGTIFFDFLKKQLIFKKIITAEEWNLWKDEFILKWHTDSYFAEVKEAEIMKNRIELAESMEPFIGKYFSHTYVMREVFQLSEDEMKEEYDQIKVELLNTQLNPPEEDF
jgi:hypothetical protein